MSCKLFSHNRVLLKRSRYKAGMKEFQILEKLRDAGTNATSRHVIGCLGHFEHKKHLCLVFEAMRYVRKTSPVSTSFFPELDLHI